MFLEKLLVPGQSDIVMDFTQLVQRGDVTSYVEWFEDMKTMVKSKHPSINDEFYISCFLKGLKEEIWVPVQMFNPRHLMVAINQAKVNGEHIGCLG